MTEIKLKPCPFCGDPNVMLEYAEDTEMYSVWCPGCLMWAAFSYDEEQARKRWNRRRLKDDRA